MAGKWEGDHDDLRNLNADGITYTVVVEGPGGIRQYNRRFCDHAAVWRHVEPLMSPGVEVWFWRCA